MAVEPIAELPYQPSSPGKGQGDARGQSGGWGKVVFLWIPTLALVGVAMLAPFSTLMEQGQSLAIAAGAAAGVFPLLPFVWHLLAERGRKESGVGRRFRLRSCGLALVVLAVSLASVGPRGLAGAVGRTTGVAAIARGDFLANLPLVGDRDLLSYVPENAQAVLVIDLDRLRVGKLVEVTKKVAGAESKGVPDFLAAIESTCDVPWREAKLLVAGAADGRFLVALQQDALAGEGTLTCVAKQLFGAVGFQGEVSVDRQVVPWAVRLPELAGQRLQAYLDDEGTLLLVSAAWNEVARLQMSDKGATPASGLLAGVLDRVDRRSGLWLVGTTATGNADQKENRSVAMSMDLEVDGLRMRGNIAVPGAAGQVPPLARFDATVPMAAVEDAIKQALATGLSTALPGLSRFIPGL